MHEDGRPCVRRSSARNKTQARTRRSEEVESDEQADRPGARRRRRRRAREKGGEIRDERALHILLYQSKQPERRPRASLSVFLCLSPFVCPPSLRARQMTECGERDYGGEMQGDGGDNRLLDGTGVLTFRRWLPCVCMRRTSFSAHLVFCRLDARARKTDFRPGALFTRSFHSEGPGLNYRIIELSQYSEEVT